MKKLSELLVDESYKSIKSFTKNNQLTKDELVEIDKFVKEIQSLMNNIEEEKEKLSLIKLGEAFNAIIENGIENVKRDS